ncbi:E3 12.5K [Bat mastadenovirus G]|uniref:E3 12.5K n=1 Tax=Bat mastadenovirus G TaxID=2015376 RepID=A0A1J0FAR1_9ADEN|nr:E3 12.5K [Bat mastadenovirus G]APC26074.1 E3 12.5K [Bat mastadenovirus G]
MAMTEPCLEQVELDCLCARHKETCTQPRCFAKDNLRAKWFYHPSVFADMDIVDSYQEGHGLTISVECTYHCSSLKVRGQELRCSSSHKGSDIKIRCLCKKPVPHSSLVDAACTMYNLH